MIAVFHAKDLFAAMEGNAKFPRDYQLAATVEGDSLDHAFAQTNNVDLPWYLNADVRPTGLSLRSTSVGDILVTPLGKALVAPAGFKDLT